eukprot:g16243.t1
MCSARQASFKLEIRPEIVLEGVLLVWSGFIATFLWQEEENTAFVSIPKSIDYLPLGNNDLPFAQNRGASVNRIRAAAGLLGMMVVGGVGWAARRTKTITQGLSNLLHMNSGLPTIGEPEYREGDFVPHAGVDEVMAKPGPPIALGMSIPNLGPNALFLYEGSIPDELTKCTSSEEGWVYGAIMEPGRKIATATGKPGDVVKGLLVEYPAIVFKDKVRTADRLYAFTDFAQGTLRRETVSVVTRDGSTTKSYWYYHSKPLHEEEAQHSARSGRQAQPQEEVEIPSRQTPEEILSEIANCTTRVSKAMNQIHSTSNKLVYEFSGAGAMALWWMHSVPGSSNTVLEATDRSSPAALMDLLGYEPEKYVSSETALGMAHQAYLRAKNLTFLSGTPSPVVGLACTAYIASSRDKKDKSKRYGQSGAHHCAVATHTDSGPVTYTLELMKGRDRMHEEIVVSQFVLRALAVAVGITTPTPLNLKDGESGVQVKSEHTLSDPVKNLKTGEVYDSVLIAARAARTTSQKILDALEGGWRSGGAHWEWYDEIVGYTDTTREN